MKKLLVILNRDNNLFFASCASEKINRQDPVAAKFWTVWCERRRWRQTLPHADPCSLLLWLMFHISMIFLNSDICCPPWGLFMCEPFVFIGFPVVCVTCREIIFHEFHSVSFNVCTTVLLHVIRWILWLNRKQSHGITKVTKHPF